MSEEGSALAANIIKVDMDLTHLMEVVTTYKCRVCSFSCSSKKNLAGHLRKAHMLMSLSTGESESVEVKRGEDGDVELDPEVMAVMQDVPSACEALTLDTNTDMLSHTDPEGSSASLTASGAKIVSQQPDSQANNMPLTSASQPNLFTLNTSTGAHNLAITAIQVTGSGLTLPSQTSVDSIAVFENSKDLGTGPTSIVPLTRELFLCGMCNAGFMSVEDCKLHMSREHGSTADLVTVSENGEIIDGRGHVSVGTQASAKRPGRKRKTAFVQPLPSPLPKIKKEDDADEDWVPCMTRDGRQRRRIRPPKALKEDYVIVKKRKYRKQRQVYIEQYTLTCSYMGCSARFRSQTALDIHLTCHNQQDMGFTCCHCQELFHSWKPLRLHLWRTHTVDVDLFQCETCEYKTDTSHKLGIHREIHSDSRPYTCDICNKGFKQLSQMKNHQIIHAEHHQLTQDRWFSSKTCEICKRSFANSKCLKKHIEAVHSKVKPFVCPYCNHATARKAMLNLHLRVHTGEKPFKCDVCPYSTGDHNSLRRHKMRHTGQRQYKCQLCSYTCIQTISLKTHMRNKHPKAEGIHMCPLCKFRSVNKQMYDNHMEDHRNGLVPETTKLEAMLPSGQTPAETNGDTTVGSENSRTSSWPMQVQMQVQTMESGEVQVSAEDLAKLSGCEGLVSGEISAAQLIYSALSVISQQRKSDGTSQTAQLLNGIQTTVTTSSLPSDKNGVTSHTIIFHLPACSALQTPNTKSGDPLLEQEILHNHDRNLQEDSAGTSHQGIDMEDDLTCQGQGQDAHLQGRESGMVQDREQLQTQGRGEISQVLYTQAARAQASHILPQEADLQVVHLAYTADGNSMLQSSLGKMRNEYSTSDGTVVVSEARHNLQGIEGVLVTEGGQLQNVMVTESGQILEGVLISTVAGDQAPETAVENQESIFAAEKFQVAEAAEAARVLAEETRNSELSDHQVETQANGNK